MDFASYKLLCCVLISAVGYVNTHVLVKAPSPIVSKMGKEPLSLECSYRTIGVGVVLSVNWYHKVMYEDTFRLIAQIQIQGAVRRPQRIIDPRLASKGNIKFLTVGLYKLVKLEINPTECTDEGTYECDVLVLGDKALHKAEVQVHLNEEPTAPLITHHPPVLMEARPVTFTCTGSLGRPLGAFRWLIYQRRAGGTLEAMEMTGVTNLSKLTGSCSPKGTSTLAVMLTRSDHKVKCVVQQQTEEDLVQVSAEIKLDVKYRVRDTVIYTKVGLIPLPITRDIIVQKGDDVYFVCRALGNPRPSFQWSYLPLGGQTPSSGPVHLSTRPELTLTSMTTNQSGSYVCVTSNNVPTMDYEETRSVRVVVKDTISNGQQDHFPVEYAFSDVERYLLIGGVVTGALLFTVFVSLLSVMCVRRCSKKSLVHQIRYTGVRG